MLKPFNIIILIVILLRQQLEDFRIAGTFRISNAYGCTYREKESYIVQQILSKKGDMSK